MNREEIQNGANVFKRSVPEIFQEIRVIAEVFQNQDSSVTEGTCCCCCQSSPAEKDKTSGNDREEVENGEYGLTPSTVIEKNGDKKDVHENLAIGERGITPDEPQNQC